MKEKTGLKREWVKTFAIIFLSVMLVLTFFSNTIMNMNLPEVSTDHIQYGTIKTQVRTSGTVTAIDNYSVTYPASREIAKVNFKKGDSVNKGDILFVLVEGDSGELEAARENYENLKYEYDRKLLLSSGKGKFAEQNRRIAELTEDLTDAKNKRGSVGSDIAKNDNDISLKKDEIAVVEADIKSLEKKINSKRTEIDALNAEKSAIGYAPTEDEVLIGRKEGVTFDEYVSAAALIDIAEAELQSAEKQLDDAKTKQKTIERELETLTRELEKLNGELSKLPTKEQLESKNREVLQSDRNIEEMERNLKYLKQEFYDATVNYDLEKLYDKYKDRQSDYKKAKSAYEKLLKSGTATEEELNRAMMKLEQESEILDEAYALYQECLTQEKTEALAEEKALGEAETSLKYALEDNGKLKEEYIELEKEYALRVAIESGTNKSGSNGSTQGINELENIIRDKQDELGAVMDAVSAAEDAYDIKVKDKEKVEGTVDKTRNEYKYTKVKEYEVIIDAKEDELYILEQQLESHKEVLEAKNKELSELKSENFESKEELDERIKTLERQLAAEKASLEDSMANATGEQKLEQLEITKMQKELDKAKAELDKLEGKIASNEITAPVTGILESVNIQAGQSFKAEDVLAEISLSELGFKMTATVAPEQAARLRPGIKAEITSWIAYGEDVTVTLDAIKSDTANPGSRQKVLEFSIEGNIEPGQNLSIAVGDKNASYDSIVPNTAIREDSQGKYVLVVESKSTAISTRYIAKRVPVTVIASDDTRSAISGEFENYAYVVATSSAPINDGDQVKLNEN